ncbi:MAG: hypothetical protein ACHQ52_06990, partial [Candidatus Eisenbacteria bacterium]
MSFHLVSPKQRSITRLVMGASLLLVMIPVLASAQVSVTATAGTTGPTVYTTLGAAFTAINGGTHQGVIGISITASTTEAAAGAVLNASGSGSASYSQVTITPSAASVRTIQGPISTAQPLVKLNGASNVTIDGRFGGSGQYLRFRIVTTTGANSGPTIMFDNTAANDVLQNCIVESRATNTSRGAISLGTLGSTNHITISGNDIRDMTVDNLGTPANLIWGNSA